VHFCARQLREKCIGRFVCRGQRLHCLAAPLDDSEYGITVAIGQLETGGAYGRGEAVQDPQTGGLGSLQTCEGEPGNAADGQSIAQFEADLRNNLYKLWNRLSSGSYFPPPVLRVEIPKADGGVRPLAIPTVGSIRKMLTPTTVAAKPAKPGPRAHAGRRDVPDTGWSRPPTIGARIVLPRDHWHLIDAAYPW
jgi:hypothetical protein